jgi:hypothetical protein
MQSLSKTSTLHLHGRKLMLQWNSCLRHSQLLAHTKRKLPILLLKLIKPLSSWKTSLSEKFFQHLSWFSSTNTKSMEMTEETLHKSFGILCNQNHFCKTFLAIFKRLSNSEHSKLIFHIHIHIKAHQTQKD